MKKMKPYRYTETSLITSTSSFTRNNYSHEVGVDPLQSMLYPFTAGKYSHRQYVFKILHELHHATHFWSDFFKFWPTTVF